MPFVQPIAAATCTASAVFFSAYTSAFGTQLWESNGTSSGTTMAVDMNGTAGANLTDFVVVGTTLYMQAPGASLWKVTT